MTTKRDGKVLISKYQGQVLLRPCYCLFGIQHHGYTNHWPFAGIYASVDSNQCHTLHLWTLYTP